MTEKRNNRSEDEPFLYVTEEGEPASYDYGGSSKGYDQEPPPNVSAIDFEDYDEYENPSWNQNSGQRTSPLDEPKGPSWWQRQQEKRSQRKEESFQKGLAKEKKERLRLERQVELQKGRTELAEYKRRARKARGKPTYAKVSSGLVKVGTLGGPVKKQNLELYGGSVPKRAYIPSAMRGLTAPPSPAVGLGAMRGLTAPKAPTGNFTAMRKLTTPSVQPFNLGGMRTLTSPGRMRTGDNLGLMRGLTMPRVGGFRRGSGSPRIIQSSNPIADIATGRVRTPKYYRKMQSRIKRDRLY